MGWTWPCLLHLLLFRVCPVHGAGVWAVWTCWLITEDGDRFVDIKKLAKNMGAIHMALHSSSSQFLSSLLVLILQCCSHILQGNSVLWQSWWICMIQNDLTWHPRYSTSLYLLWEHSSLFFATKNVLHTFVILKLYIIWCHGHGQCPHCGQHTDPLAEKILVLGSHLHLKRDQPVSD